MDRFAARRKILRGSLSAPLVLTVASPAALARQSFEACLYRASQQSPADAPAFIEVTAHDTWLRKRVPVYEGKLKAASKKELFYKNADGAFYKVNADACSSGPYAATKDVFSQLPEPTGGAALALVHVNSKGDVVGWGTCVGSGEFPVSTSCWASFGGMQQV